MQAGGERAGKRVRLTIDDAHAVAELPLVAVRQPGDRARTCPSLRHQAVAATWFAACRPEYGAMRTEIPRPGGRFLSATRTCSCVGAWRSSASEVNRKLFGKANAVGQTIRISGMSFEVIGVMKEKAQLSNYFRPDKESVFIPYTVVSQLWYQPWLTSSSGRPSIR